MINVRFGTVHDFGYINSLITKVYLKLDDINASKNPVLKDSFALNHQVLPIKMVEANIKISKNSAQTFQKNSISTDMYYTQSTRS